jgi:hypothetical protein
VSGEGVRAHDEHLVVLLPAPADQRLDDTNRAPEGSTHGPSRRLVQNGVDDDQASERAGATLNDAK